MASTTRHDPKYLLQEPQSGLYLSGEQPVYMDGGAKLSKRPEAARFPTYCDAVLAAHEMFCSAGAFEIVRVDA